MAKKLLNFSVGLEIHARLKTDHKIFCGCLNHYGDKPNTNTCPVCLGLPGSLPVFNQEVLEPAIKATVALGCHLPLQSEFSRKNYFYPDLPRNYQITQFERPLAEGGSLICEGPNSEIKVRLQRAHLEEDAGRTLHGLNYPQNVDFNRAGTPLLEIVTEPDLKDGPSARIWLGRLRQLLRWLEVCDGDMEKGSFRVDANVGLMDEGLHSGAWVELKNLNSLKAVSLAVDFEIQRLSTMIQTGTPLVKETRSWDSGTRQTSLLRVKETSSEYRYFPEPDLPLLTLDQQKVEQVKNQMIELPMAREARFRNVFGLRGDDSITMCRTLWLADYFETCIDLVPSGAEISPEKTGSLTANWILGPLLKAVKGKDRELFKLPLAPRDLASIIHSQSTESISHSIARRMVESKLNRTMEDGVFEVQSISAQESLLSKPALEKLCQVAITSNPGQWEACLAGKNAVLNFFVGWVLKRAEGQTEAQKVRCILTGILDDHLKKNGEN